MNEKIELPWYKRYPKDFLTSQKIQMMNLEEIGAYCLLLEHQWIQGKLPKDTKKLARLCRTTEEKFKEIWSEISDCFEETDEGIINPRMHDERKNAMKKKRKLKKAGRKGGKKSSKNKGGLREAKGTLKQRSKGPSTNKDVDTDTDVDKDNTSKSARAREIFEYFVKKDNLTSHRNLTSGMRKTINARLQNNWTVEEIKNVIDKYNILSMKKKSDNYEVYGIHESWTLEQLFKRSEGEKAQQILEDDITIEKKNNSPDPAHIPDEDINNLSEDYF